MAIIHVLGRYGLVGIINTAVHWLMFSLFYFVFNTNQAIANTVAFMVAVTVSFYLNAHFTFNTYTNLKRYLLFVVFMGFISYLVGFFADKSELLPLLTLCIFTAISFIVGFLWSRFFVFKK